MTGEISNRKIPVMGVFSNKLFKRSFQDLFELFNQPICLRMIDSILKVFIFSRLHISFSSQDVKLML